MNQETIDEYLEIVSSTCISSSSDSEAREKLALLGSELRNSLEELLGTWDDNPNEFRLQGYLGLMFLNVVRTSKSKLLAQFSSKFTPAHEVLKSLREQSALQIEKSVVQTAKRIEGHNPEYLWTGIQLALLIPIPKQWSATIDLEKHDNE